MEKLKAKIDAAMASIDKVRAYQVEGSSNPLFKARTSYGVAEHSRRQGSCDAKEILISRTYLTSEQVIAVVPPVDVASDAGE